MDKPALHVPPANISVCPSAAARGSSRWVVRLDLSLSKAGSTAHFDAPVVAGRITAAIEGRIPAGKRAESEGKVMCSFEIGDAMGEIVFNKTRHAVPKGRV